MERGVSVHRKRSVPRGGQEGFSLVELLIVSMIIVVMAAVALPNIGRYIRNYKIRGGSQEVAGELTAARSKAIMSNTNAGVSLVIVDADSYRYVMEDLPAGPPVDERLGLLRDLPGGVRFVPTTATDSGSSVRFNRLGGYCNPDVNCAAPAANPCTAPETSDRCNDGGGANYVAPDGTAGGLVITLTEASTGLLRTVRLAPGGRVLPQP